MTTPPKASGAPPSSIPVPEEANTANGDATGHNAAPLAHRGLDAGLAKSVPDASNLTAENYRNFRRRVEVFERCCRRRGAECISEGAPLLLQSLTGEA